MALDASSTAPAKPTTVQELHAIVGTAQRLYLQEHLPYSHQPPPALMPAVVSLLVMFVLLSVCNYWYSQSFPSFVGAFAYPLMCSVGGVIWGLWLRRKRRTAIPVRWLVNFDARTLEPIDKPAAPKIVLNSTEYSLGCYPKPLDVLSATELILLLELRSVKKGPIAAICYVGVLARQDGADPKALADLDDCLNTFAQRLGIPRSGASLRATALRAKR